jgi:hypothetical protein
MRVLYSVMRVLYSVAEQMLEKIESKESSLGISIATDNIQAVEPNSNPFQRNQELRSDLPPG